MKERTYGSEKEWMGRRIGGRRRGGKGGGTLLVSPQLALTERSLSHLARSLSAD